MLLRCNHHQYQSHQAAHAWREGELLSEHMAEDGIGRSSARIVFRYELVVDTEPLSLLLLLATLASTAFWL